MIASRFGRRCSLIIVIIKHEQVVNLVKVSLVICCGLWRRLVELRYLVWQG